MKMRHVGQKTSDYLIQLVHERDALLLRRDSAAAEIQKQVDQIDALMNRLVDCDDVGDRPNG